MRTFIIRARKGTTRWDRVKSQIGSKEHFEVIIHSIMNAFFISSSFREDVKFHIILDSAEDFPHTITLVGGEGLSISGFHEDAIADLIGSVDGLPADLSTRKKQYLQAAGYGRKRSR